MDDKRNDSLPRSDYTQRASSAPDSDLQMHDDHSVNVRVSVRSWTRISVDGNFLRIALRKLDARDGRRPKSIQFMLHVHLGKSSWKTFGKERKGSNKKAERSTGQTFLLPHSP